MRIETRDLTLAIGGHTLLDGVSLTVADGSLTSVLGESGAGKSTLLNVIAGLAIQDGGTVLFDDTCVDDVPTNRRDVSMVFQDSRLFPTMSVADNVAFPLKVRGIGRRERREQAEEMLGRVQLAGMGTRRPAELSGGQRQRVALARALVARPSAVLLDEPFSGLDESLREDMRQLVLRLHGELGITMMMVTHDPLEALTMSDRVLYLSRGRVLQDGTPDRILLAPAAPEVAASFRTACALEGAVRAGTFAQGRLAIPAPGVADGPAVMLRTSDGVVGVYPKSPQKEVTHG